MIRKSGDNGFMPKTGYVVARRLYDDDYVLKWFAFYPREFHGIPPHYGKTKESALRSYKKLYHKLPDNIKTKLLPVSQVKYIDRF